MYGALFDLKDVPASLRDCFEEVEVECGAPLVRVVESRMAFTQATHARTKHLNGDASEDRTAGFAQRAPVPGIKDTRTLSWRPSCSCTAGVSPARVLDPFAGSGTTLKVAMELGRDAVGIDLQPTYVQIAERRLARDPYTVATPQANGSTTIERRDLFSWAESEAAGATNGD